MPLCVFLNPNSAGARRTCYTTNKTAAEPGGADNIPGLHTSYKPGFANKMASRYRFTGRPNYTSTENASRDVIFRCLCLHSESQAHSTFVFLANFKPSPRPPRPISWSLARALPDVLLARSPKSDHRYKSRSVTPPNPDHPPRILQCKSVHLCRTLPKGTRQENDECMLTIVFRES